MVSTRTSAQMNASKANTGRDSLSRAHPTPTPPELGGTTCPHADRLAGPFPAPPPSCPPRRWPAPAQGPAATCQYGRRLARPSSPAGHAAGAGKLTGNFCTDFKNIDSNMPIPWPAPAASRGRGHLAEVRGGVGVDVPGPGQLVGKLLATRDSRDHVHRFRQAG